MTLLSDLKIAIITADGVNHSEVASPRESLEKAGVSVDIVSDSWPEVKTWSGTEWDVRVQVDKRIDDASLDDYQGIIIPGGPLHSDTLRENQKLLQLIKQQFSSGKMVAAVGHGIQVLINADVLEGREVTACQSVHNDVVNAGAMWTEKNVVCDNGLITCRCNDNIEEFSNILLEDLKRGVHQRTETII